jgi:hypothetical protein
VRVETCECRPPSSIYISLARQNQHRTWSALNFDFFLFEVLRNELRDSTYQVNVVQVRSEILNVIHYAIEYLGDGSPVYVFENPNFVAKEKRTIPMWCANLNRRA